MGLKFRCVNLPGNVSHELDSWRAHGDVLLRMVVLARRLGRLSSNEGWRLFSGLLVMSLLKYSSTSLLLMEAKPLGS